MKIGLILVDIQKDYFPGSFMAALQSVYAKVMDLGAFSSWMIQNFSNQPG